MRGSHKRDIVGARTESSMRTFDLRLLEVVFGRSETVRYSLHVGQLSEF